MESDDFNLRNLREWQPIDNVFHKIPPKIQKGFFFQELHITCIDALPEYLAFGSNVGIIFWYNRHNGNVQKLRTEVSLIHSFLKSHGAKQTTAIKKNGSNGKKRQATSVSRILNESQTVCVFFSVNR